MFPQRLDAPQAYAIAQALMHGFNLHYRMFSAEAARAKQRFESMDWQGQQQRERIAFYDLQVRACIQRLEEEFEASQQSMAVWQQVKLHYIGLMVDHLQPELAETFSTRSPPRSCTARTFTTTSSLCARPSARSIWKIRSPGPSPLTGPTIPAVASIWRTRCRRCSSNCNWLAL